LEAFSALLREQTPRVLPKSALGQAIKYCRNQWERLILKDGRLEIDNNQGKWSIKPFIIGGKNWLFINTQRELDQFLPWSPAIPKECGVPESS
jgi:transposase